MTNQSISVLNIYALLITLFLYFSISLLFALYYLLVYSFIGELDSISFVHITGALNTCHVYIEYKHF